tara:strand:+ start:2091 stop:2375 length:285 start_codon:yes stop_codon:yes gene_type:complete
MGIWKETQPIDLVIEDIRTVLSAEGGSLTDEGQMAAYRVAYCLIRALGTGPAHWRDETVEASCIHSYEKIDRGEVSVNEGSALMDWRTPERKEE